MKSYEIAAPAHVALEAWRQFVRAGDFLAELQDVRFEPLDSQSSRTVTRRAFARRSPARVAS
jgi:adenine-specific DNA methylase